MSFDTSAIVPENFERLKTGVMLLCVVSHISRLPVGCTLLAFPQKEDHMQPDRHRCVNGFTYTIGATKKTYLGTEVLTVGRFD